MTTETAWFVGTPLLGASAIALGLVVPHFQKRALAAGARDEPRVLPLIARRVAAAPPENLGAGPAAPVAPLVGEGPDPDAAVAEGTPPVAAVGRPLFGLRLARGLAGALRRRSRSPAAPTVVDARSADACVSAAADAERADDRGDEFAAAPAATNLVRFIPPSASVPEPAVSSAMAPDAAPVRDGQLSPHEALDLQARENGIIDLEVPPGEEPVAWRTWVLAREAAISERDAELERSRAAAEEAERRREAEVAALARQREIENIAIAEEARARSEARARKWYARLDLDLDAPTIEERMVLATSLGSVRASWAGKLLRDAFVQEEDARIRARVIGALVSADHLDVVDPFREAVATGGLERAAVFETLMPRQHEAAWISELLAPLLVA